MAYVDVRDEETGTLLFRYDPCAREVEIQVTIWDPDRRYRRKLLRVVDLDECGRGGRRGVRDPMAGTRSG